MEIFNVFNEGEKNKFLCSPLNHPNIEYEWIEKKIQLDNSDYNINYIGRFIDDGSIDIVSLEETKIGFYDKNKNFVTTILFHPINLENEGYQIIYNYINNLLSSNRKPVESLSEPIKNIIELMKDDDQFYMDLLKYIHTNRLEFSKPQPFNEKDVDDLILFVTKKNKDDLIKEYSHLKLMKTILDNRAI